LAKPHAVTALQGPSLCRLLRRYHAGGSPEGARDDRSTDGGAVHAEGARAATLLQGPAPRTPRHPRGDDPWHRRGQADRRLTRTAGHGAPPADRRGLRTQVPEALHGAPPRAGTIQTFLDPFPRPRWSGPPLPGAPLVGRSLRSDRLLCGSAVVGTAVVRSRACRFLSLRMFLPLCGTSSPASTHSIRTRHHGASWR